VDALLGDASAAFKRAYNVFKRAYNVTPAGNWEGHTVAGHSERHIAAAIGVSRYTVAGYLHRATVVGITRPVTAELDDSAFEARLFSPPFAVHGGREGSQTGHGCMPSCAVPASPCCYGRSIEPGNRKGTAIVGGAGDASRWTWDGRSDGCCRSRPCDYAIPSERREILLQGARYEHDGFKAALFEVTELRYDVFTQRDRFRHRDLASSRLVPIRYVLVRDVFDEFKPQAFLYTDPDADPRSQWRPARYPSVVRPLVYAEVRRHLGLLPRCAIRVSWPKW
jgi:hypothetical protein